MLLFFSFFLPFNLWQIKKTGNQVLNDAECFYVNHFGVDKLKLFICVRDGVAATMQADNATANLIKCIFERAWKLLRIYFIVFVTSFTGIKLIIFRNLV